MRNAFGGKKLLHQDPGGNQVDGLLQGWSQAKVGFRDVACGACWLCYVVFWVSFFDFLRDENDSAEHERILDRKAK